MSNFTRGLVIGSVIGTALGMTGMGTPWMKKKVWRPSKNAMKRVGKVMSEMANMM